MEVCRFFRTGRPPVDAAETLEIVAFMEAAEESKRRGGVPVPLESVMAREQVLFFYLLHICLELLAQVRSPHRHA